MDNAGEEYIHIDLFEHIKYRAIKLIGWMLEKEGSDVSSCLQ